MTLLLFSLLRHILKLLSKKSLSLNPVKAIAFLVVIFMCVEQVAQAASPIGTHIESPKSHHKKFQSISKFGIVEEVFNSKKSSKQIFLIQDAHTNFSSQINTQKILKEIFNKNELKYIFLEAGEGDESLNYIINKVSKKDREEIGFKNLRKGKLQGAEYFHLLEENSVLWGVENPELYFNSWRLYKDITKKRDESLSELDKIESNIKLLKTRLYNSHLLAFDLIHEKYLKQEMALTEYMAILLGEAKVFNLQKNYPNLSKILEIREKEIKLNFDQISLEQKEALEFLGKENPKALRELRFEIPQKINNLALQQSWGIRFENLLKESLRSNSTSRLRFSELFRYFGYLKSYQNLDHKRILKEKDELEKKLFSKFCISEDERLLVGYVRDLRLTQKLVDLKITPDEFRRIKTKEKVIESITGFINEAIIRNRLDYEKLIFLNEDLVDTIKKSKAFYEGSFKRDEYFIQQILQKMSSENEKNGVLIVGGFHANQIKKLLKKKNISYTSVLPYVDHETNRDRYENILLSQNPEKIVLTKSNLIRAPSTLMEMRPAAARLSMFLEGGDAPRAASDDDLKRRLKSYYEPIVVWSDKHPAYTGDDIEKNLLLREGDIRRLLAPIFDVRPRSPFTILVRIQTEKSYAIRLFYKNTRVLTFSMTVNNDNDAELIQQAGNPVKMSELDFVNWPGLLRVLYQRVWPRFFSERGFESIRFRSGISQDAPNKFFEAMGFKKEPDSQDRVLYFKDWVSEENPLDATGARLSIQHSGIYARLISDSEQMRQEYDRRVDVILNKAKVVEVVRRNLKEKHGFSDSEVDETIIIVHGDYLFTSKRDSPSDIDLLIISPKKGFRLRGSWPVDDFRYPPLSFELFPQDELLKEKRYQKLLSLILSGYGTIVKNGTATPKTSLDTFYLINDDDIFERAEHLYDVALKELSLGSLGDPQRRWKRLFESYLFLKQSSLRLVDSGEFEEFERTVFGGVLDDFYRDFYLGNNPLPWSNDESHINLFDRKLRSLIQRVGGVRGARLSLASEGVSSSWPILQGLARYRVFGDKDIRALVKKLFEILEEEIQYEVTDLSEAANLYRLAYLLNLESDLDRINPSIKNSVFSIKINKSPGDMSRDRFSLGYPVEMVGHKIYSKLRTADYRRILGKPQFVSLPRKRANVLSLAGGKGLPAREIAPLFEDSDIVLVEANPLNVREAMANFDAIRDSNRYQIRLADARRDFDGITSQDGVFNLAVMAGDSNWRMSQSDLNQIVEEVFRVLTIDSGYFLVEAEHRELLQPFFEAVSVLERRPGKGYEVYGDFITDSVVLFTKSKVGARLAMNLRELSISAFHEEEDSSMAKAVESHGLLKRGIKKHIGDSGVHELFTIRTPHPTQAGKTRRRNLSLPLKDYKGKSVRFRFSFAGKGKAKKLLIHVYALDSNQPSNPEMDKLIYKAYYDKKTESFIIFGSNDHLRQWSQKPHRPSSIPDFDESIEVNKSSGKFRFYLYRIDGDNRYISLDMKSSGKQTLGFEKLLSKIYVYPVYSDGNKYLYGFIESGETDPKRAFARWVWNPKTQNYDQDPDFKLSIPGTIEWFHEVATGSKKAHKRHYYKAPLTTNGKGITKEFLGGKQLPVKSLFTLIKRPLPDSVLIVNSNKEPNRLDIYDPTRALETTGVVDIDTQLGFYVGSIFYDEESGTYKYVKDELANRYEAHSESTGGDEEEAQKGVLKRLSSNRRDTLISFGEGELVYFQRDVDTDHRGGLVYVDFSEFSHDEDVRRGVTVYQLNDGLNPTRILKRGYREDDGKFVWISVEERSDSLITGEVRKSLRRGGYIPNEKFSRDDLNYPVMIVFDAFMDIRELNSKGELASHREYEPNILRIIHGLDKIDIKSRSSLIGSVAGWYGRFDLEGRRDFVLKHSDLLRRQGILPYIMHELDLAAARLANESENTSSSQPQKDLSIFSYYLYRYFENSILGGESVAFGGNVFIPSLENEDLVLKVRESSKEIFRIKLNEAKRIALEEEKDYRRLKDRYIRGTSLALLMRFKNAKESFYDDFNRFGMSFDKAPSINILVGASVFSSTMDPHIYEAQIEHLISSLISLRKTLPNKSGVKFYLGEDVRYPHLVRHLIKNYKAEEFILLEEPHQNESFVEIAESSNLSNAKHSVKLGVSEVVDESIPDWSEVFYQGILEVVGFSSSNNNVDFENTDAITVDTLRNRRNRYLATDIQDNESYLALVSGEAKISFQRQHEWSILTPIPFDFVIRTLRRSSQLTKKSA